MNQDDQKRLRDVEQITAVHSDQISGLRDDTIRLDRRIDGTDERITTVSKEVTVSNTKIAMFAGLGTLCATPIIAGLIAIAFKLFTK